MQPAFSPVFGLFRQAWTRSGRRVFAAVAIGLSLLRIAVAEERSAAPSLVLTARSAADLIDNVDRLLTIAGAPERVAQMRGVLQALDGLNGVDHDRPLGVLAYLSPVAGKEPELVIFVPIRSMDDLQQTAARVPQVTLAARADDGWWELRAGPKTLPLRLSADYAFVAQRDELLADPLPIIADVASPEGDFDLSLTLRTDGIPAALLARTLADLQAQQDRDLQRKAGESDDDFALRAGLLKEAGWLVEHTLRDVTSATVGMRLGDDSDIVAVDARIVTRPDSELSRALQAVPADASLFQSLLDADAPLAAVASCKLTGGVHRIAQDALANIRRDVEHRMEQDGTANGPAAPPIRRILDAFAATVADGRINGCLRFDGERPGAMLLISATRLADDPGVADALESLLPLIAETPAVADLEMNAIEVDGIRLHRLTLQDVR
ncbi:MAG: hypothetical protein JNG89_04340, partial [Planctomycetaceae bacterium]|nr:hypothetical protein [Planctomycetaceae bacterium]